MIHTLDLNFFTDQAIASFLIESDAGPILVESGPHSVIKHLEEALAQKGYGLSDIGHVLLTHIHFDHAGAAWALAEAGAQVYVHPIGYPHMLDPSRLYNSAQRIYGDAMETLWGQMKGIKEHQLHAVEDQEKIQIGDLTFTAWHTPGHAKHHIAWQLGSDIFTGDVAGCAIAGGPVVPPCPPPDIDIEAWKSSLNLLRQLNPETLYLTHFGAIKDIEGHLHELENRLDAWASWIKVRFDQGLSPREVVPDFQKYAQKPLLEAGLSERAMRRYDAANPPDMSVAGLMRYFAKKNK